MILKQRIGDFRVRELLEEGYVTERGEHRLYRVTKRKLTTPEAISILAREAGVEPGAVGVAGYKDRQAITIQYMSIPRGRSVRLRSSELNVDVAGFAHAPLTSEVSRGNAFELNVRGLHAEDLRRLRRNLKVVREHGLVDYFDDQRFGNLRYGQGWIVRDLMLGQPEQALRALLATPHARDDDRHRNFKRSLERSWGDWRECRDAAGKFGAHHSIFEHLAKNEGDFAGAFTYVASRVRLIHLYAWQSHLWNRAVADWVRREVPLEQRVLLESEEGTLVTYDGAPPESLLRKGSFRLPGEGLEDVTDPEELAAFEEVLAAERMVADQLRVEGVSGFQLKGEPRTLLVTPRHLRVRPAEDDPLQRGMRMVRVRFELPRGAYASLVVKRLFAARPGEAEAQGARRREQRARRDAREGGDPGATRATRATRANGARRTGDPADRRGGHSRGGHGGRPGGGYRSGHGGERGPGRGGRGRWGERSGDGTRDGARDAAREGGRDGERGRRSWGRERGGDDGQRRERRGTGRPPWGRRDDTSERGGARRGGGERRDSHWNRDGRSEGERRGGRNEGRREDRWRGDRRQGGRWRDGARHDGPRRAGSPGDDRDERDERDARDARGGRDERDRRDRRDGNRRGHAGRRDGDDRRSDRRADEPGRGSHGHGRRRHGGARGHSGGGRRRNEGQHGRPGGRPGGHGRGGPRRRSDGDSR